jgi:multiple sugar transport system ATP-binding protein
MGTHQIVTLSTAYGTALKARIPSDVAVRPGDVTGLDFSRDKLSIFDAASGRALLSRLHGGGDA